MEYSPHDTLKVLASIAAIREQLHEFDIENMAEFDRLILALSKLKENPNLTSQMLTEASVKTARPDVSGAATIQQQSSQGGSKFSQSKLAYDFQLDVYSTAIDRTARENCILVDIFKNNIEAMNMAIDDAVRVLQGLRELIEYGRLILNKTIDETHGIQPMFIFFLTRLLALCGLDFEVHAANNVPLKAAIRVHDTNDSRPYIHSCFADISCVFTGCDNIVTHFYNVGQMKALLDALSCNRAKDQTLGEVLAVRQMKKATEAKGYLTDLMSLFLIHHESERVFYVSESVSSERDYICNLLLLFCKPKSFSKLMKRNSVAVNSDYEAKNTYSRNLRSSALQSSSSQTQKISNLGKRKGGHNDDLPGFSDSSSDADRNTFLDYDSEAERWRSECIRLETYASKLAGQFNNYEPVTVENLKRHCAATRCINKDSLDTDISMCNSSN